MYEIVWTLEAQKTYFDTLNFWIENNESNIYSLKIIKTVEESEIMLSKNPYVGKLVENMNIRRIIVLNHFSIFYRIKINTIEILSFWDNRRNPDTLKITI